MWADGGSRRRRRIGRLDPVTKISATLLAAVAVVAGLGLLWEVADDPWQLFDLDDEVNPAAAFSALLLLGAAALTQLAARGVGGTALRPIAALFAFMAVDEFFQLHEWIERRTGVDWQVLYLPLFAIGGACFLAVLARQRHRRDVVVTSLAGAGAWASSQLLEWFQWHRGGATVRGYTALMMTEEVLEMLGTVGFIVAMLLLTRPETSKFRSPTQGALEATYEP